MPHKIDSSRPHHTVLATVPNDHSQQQLSNYEAIWPPIAHDPDADLSAPAMGNRAIDDKRTAIREGTIVTINTVLQAEVIETDLSSTLIEPFFDTPPKEYKLNIARLTPIHPTITDDILLILQGGYNKTQAYIPLEAKSKAPVEIRDLRTHNEHNLQDNIDINLYETLKLYHGGSVFQLSSKGTTPNHKLTIGNITRIADGTITFENANKRSKTELQVTPKAITDDWFFIPKYTSATQPRRLYSPDGTEGVKLDTTTSDAQQSALNTIHELPQGTYTVTPRGIYRTEMVGGSMKGIKLIDGNTTRTAFNFSLNASSPDPISPTPGDAPSPDDPITDLTGIGPVTGKELSGVASLPSTSSRTSITDQFTPLPKEPDLETENWTGNNELHTVPADNIPPEITGEATDTADIVDYVRKLPEDEIPQALINAQENHTPSKASPNSPALDTIEEFIKNGTPVHKASKQYFLQAVADLRAYIEAHHEQTHNESLDSALLRLHAGATVGQLLAPDGTKEGKLPNLLFNNCSIDNIAGVEAWMPQSNVLPQLESRSPSRYLLYRDTASAFPNGPLELSKMADPWTHPGTELNATQVSRLEKTVTFHQDVASDATDIPHATIHKTVADYIATLAGNTLTGPQFLTEHVTMTTKSDLFINLPQTGLTFAILN